MLKELTPIPAESTRWGNRPLLAEVPVLNFYDGLECLLDAGELTFVGYGSHGVVFRYKTSDSDQQDMAIKISRVDHLNIKQLMRKMFGATGYQDVEQDEIDALCPKNPWGDQFAQVTVWRQVAGHVLGNIVDPAHIDAPLCIWFIGDSSLPYAIGYSIPFIQGDPIKICDDPELSDLAERLERIHGIYVGNKGEGSANNSLNAVILPNGNKKFIDVRLVNTRNYSMPLESGRI
ncbi:MAG: hypothetical protein HYT83_02040 [Candidatus Levybacteria bacterium]|nr:hypothetical protein [Candidatus Levybacteria bacterium]